MLLLKSNVSFSLVLKQSFFALFENRRLGLVQHEIPNLNYIRKLFKVAISCPKGKSIYNIVIFIMVELFSKSITASNIASEKLCVILL